MDQSEFCGAGSGRIYDSDKSTTKDKSQEGIYVSHVAKLRFSVTELASPIVEEVKQQPRSCHVFYFAGHGRVNCYDLTQISLGLQMNDEANAVMVQDPLSIGDVGRTSLAHPELVYL